MKKRLLSLALIGLSFASFAQTAIDFVGSGFINVPNANTALNGDPSWTIEFWLQDPDNNCFPFSSGGNYVRIFPNGVIQFNGFMQSNAGAWPTDGQPHHIAFRSSPSAGAQIFVDGLPVSMAFGGPIGFGTGTVTLGSQFSSTTEVIDDFRVWDLSRSNAEILANYNQCLTGSETGLQIFYDFETGSGTTIVTNQGNAGGINNGSLNGMNPFTSWITGIDGCFTNPHALDFEKSSPDQYVDCGTSINSIFQGGEEVTVEAWIKAESTAGLPTILGNYDSGSMQYLLRIDGGLPTFWVGTPGFTSCSATTSISTGVWTHISGTYDGSNIRIYVNGVLENTVAKTGVFAANSNSFKIGNSAIAGSEEFDGVIDDVRIWNCVKSDAAILADMNALYTGSESLVAYYDFSDGSGTTLTDLSGNGYHGTLQTGGNLPTWIAGQTLSGAPSFTGCPCVILEQTITEVDFSSCTSTSATVNLDNSENGLQYFLRNNLDNSLIDGPITGTGSGISFAAGTVSATTTFNVLAQVSSAPTTGLEFDGTNEHAVGPDAGLPLGNDSRTIQGWIKTIGAIDGPEYIIEYGNNVAAGNECALGLHGTGVATLWRHSGDILGTTLIDDGNWHHLAYTHDGTTGKLYVDGALEGSISVPLNTAATGNFQLGSGSSDYLGGAIDNVSIWDYAKTESEIQDEMLTCFDGNEVGLVAYWDLNDGTGSGVATDKTGNGYDATLTNMEPSSDWITAMACVECELEMADQLTITIGDTESPVPDAATLSNVTAECSVTTLTAPTATDNCAGALTGTHNATLPITTQGTTTVTWTYDDGNGNTATQTQDVVIDDVTMPVADVTTLSDVTAECSVTTLIAPTATDNCAGALTGTHNATLPITAQGTTTVTWTYDDGNGNTSTQMQDVVIDDVTAPVGDVATLSDITAECSVTSLTAPTATDNCAGAITGTHNATLPITTQGTTTVTWTYNDGNGNTSTQTQDVVIDDVTAPVADVATLSDVTAECSVTSLTAPTATDNCAGAITGTHNATLPITTQGTTTVTWTYDDGNGNTSTQTQDVVIDDASAPVADVATLSDITAECSVTSLTAPTATDNCAGAITGTHNATLPITTQGTTTVIWTYDDGNGNTSTQTQDVVIDDATAPVADVATLSDVTAECSVTSLTAPTATDNCAGAITGTHNATLPITAQGTTTVTWTYNDGNGNTSTQTQDVVIDDVTAPVADVATLSDITAECSVTSLTAPTATDNCAGAITGTHNATLPITTQGTTTVTWTYDDGNGNTSTQTQDVVIDDVSAPVLVACPSNITQSADASGCSSVVTWTAPTATDNCSSSPAVTTSHAPGSTFAIGTTTVTYTATDDEGNMSTCSFDVTITSDLTVSPTIPTNASCAGSTDGIATIDVSGGTTAYTFDWDNDGTGDNDDAEDLTGIGAGTYTVIVTDANGCTVTTSSTINEPTPVVIDALVGTDPSACGLIDGSIDITVSGGAGLYVYDWDNDGTGDFDDVEDLSGIGSGTYNVEVQDGNGCSTSSSINLSDPSGPSVAITSTTDNVCFGDANGSIDATITGGLAPLTIDWDNDGTGDNDDTEDLSGLTANTYNLVVTDANGCVGSTSATITDPAEIYMTEVATICSNDSLFLEGAYQSTAGIYMDTLSTVVNGCDSIIETTLSINLAHEITMTPVTICDGDSVMVFGTYYSIAGIYYDSLMTTNSCDSVLIQEVIINSVDATVSASGTELTANAAGTGVTYQWIDCSDNSVITGETNQVFNATANGDYAVIVEDNGCIDTSGCETISGIGFDELELTFNVYPNPNQGEFVVQFDQELNEANLEIYSLSGQLITSQTVSGNKVEVNMIEAERGTYVIKVQSERVVVVKRFVKH
ncbi:MAG: LamG-like jellyroll fold domain-containing protein [Crocinitomicaceae bacterium]